MIQSRPEDSALGVESDYSCPNVLSSKEFLVPLTVSQTDTALYKLLGRGGLAVMSILCSGDVLPVVRPRKPAYTRFSGAPALSGASDRDTFSAT
jgi:hypothetical protein